MGGASGYLAVLVLALYINSDEVVKLYTKPAVLWLICPLLLFWISRMWLLAHRGQIDEDPIVAAGARSRQLRRRRTGAPRARTRRSEVTPITIRPGRSWGRYPTARHSRVLPVAGGMSRPRSAMCRSRPAVGLRPQLRRQRPQRGRRPARRRPGWTGSSRSTNPTGCCAARPASHWRRSSSWWCRAAGSCRWCRAPGGSRSAAPSRTTSTARTTTAPGPSGPRDPARAGALRRERGCVCSRGA